MDDPRFDQSDADRLEFEAQAFAEAHHGRQQYGDVPYTAHLGRVREILGAFGYDGALGVAAWLHDTIEDTEATYEIIAATFGTVVATLVWAVTGEGDDREARNDSAYAKIRATPDAAILKLADRIANVEASSARPDKLGMYRDEWPGFSSALAGLGDERMWTRLRNALGLAPTP